MTVRQLSQMLRTPLRWGRSLIVGTERRENRLRAYRGLLLVAYLVMNLGLPTGLGPKVAVAANDKSCRCSAESRAAGRCCCSVKAGQKPRGCCVNSSAQHKPAVTKSCCAKKAASKPAEAAVAASEQSPEAMLAWTGACPCSPNNDLSMLLCAYPRILMDVGSIEFYSEVRDSVSLLSQTPCGDRARPCVPPPEASLV